MNRESETTEFGRLIAELKAIRAAMLDDESAKIAQIERLHPAYQASARNLVHYLALRRHDLRPLQVRLSAWGLSSLGRAEANVMANIEAVLRALLRFAGQSLDDVSSGTVYADYTQGKKLLEKHTQDLLGPKPENRSVRIMVTMPTEAATDPALIEALLANGMDCARINCAHDNPDVWQRMVANVREIERRLNRKCRILMDLAGPKLRTGPLAAGPEVVKWRPRRDSYGRVTAPAPIWLYPSGTPVPAPECAASALPVPGSWLAQSKVGDQITFRDARNRFRLLKITKAVGEFRWAEADRTAYVTTGTRLSLKPANPSDLPGADSTVGPLPPQDQHILLKKGDRLVLTQSLEPGRPSVQGRDGNLLAPACIGCTLPEVFRDLRPGERILLDDGKIAGVVLDVTPDHVVIEVNQARPRGEKLRADKGINLPDTQLQLPALTPKDIEDLKSVVALADMVGYSFVRSPANVDALESHLFRLGGQHLGIILKIETRNAFERLPELLLASMLSPCDGVMIARGDLAVECGYERLPEIQEEILWICEAAHIPVLWATQVLENMAKEGAPSRAEVTDAAMANRAECVMLNKGPHIIATVRALDDILRRMEARQSKKRSLLGPLGVA